jgi:DNA processing protein
MSITDPLLSEEDVFFRLQLARSAGVGFQTYQKLVARYERAELAIRAITENPQLHRVTLACSRLIRLEIKETYDAQGAFIWFDDSRYPHWLKHIYDPPILLVARGRVELLSQPMLAVVGTRDPSHHGLAMVTQLTAGWSPGESAGDGSCHPVWVSGMARGIDTQMHQSTLQLGTIGVIATGINVCYPTENKNLYQKMFHQGLIITEMPYGTPPKAHLFPRRNRLIAGLSLATLVVEATLRSGSLVTARMALEHGREVMAVPASPLDARSQGVNSLLKQGAHCITSREDLHVIWSELILAHQLNHPFPRRSISFTVPRKAEPDIKSQKLMEGSKVHHADNPLYQKIIKIIGAEALDVESLSEQISIPLYQLLGALAELELQGILERDTLHRYHRFGTK